jgi:ABC-2 type transport system permease protein
MNKTWLIIKREYITRVRNKTFLLSTFLLPFMIVLFIAGSVFLAAKSEEKHKTIAFSDSSRFLKPLLKSDSAAALSFIFDATVDTLNYTTKGFNGFVYLDDSVNHHIILRTQKAASMGTISSIEDKLNEAYQNYQLQESGISRQYLDSIKKASSEFFSVDNKGDDDKIVNAGINYAVGFGSGILIYITMFVFGAMVMRGVMEEKTNRIAEVMVSSVKPFQLMLGKILGIGAVGLTQLLLWIMLMSVLSIAASAFLPGDIMGQVQQIQNNPAVMNNNAAQFNEAAKLLANVSSLNWPLIISCFIFYFVGGYLFYSSLFAAVGSVVNEDPQEAQSLMLPIMMPIVFGFIILSSNLNTPDNDAMFWGSMIPFTSPIVMMGRIATSPPWWQLALSMALLIGGFLFTTWMAGKIYRTGILMYGKKPSWKEMIKWTFRK